MAELEAAAGGTELQLLGSCLVPPPLLEAADAEVDGADISTRLDDDVAGSPTAEAT